jgi:hypothetical protein
MVPISNETGLQHTLVLEQYYGRGIQQFFQSKKISS